MGGERGLGPDPGGASGEARRLGGGVGASTWVGGGVVASTWVGGGVGASTWGGQPQPSGVLPPDDIDLPAESDDVAVGKCVNSKGEDVPLEAVLEGLRGEYRTHSDDVKIEEYETVRVPVDSLRYTQATCSSRFRCGKPVDETIREFAMGLDPTSVDWCMLSVIKRDGLLLSVDNRRLYALKEAQRVIREHDPTKVLYVRIKLYTWMPIFDRFLYHLDHECFASDGRRISIRGAKRYKPSWRLTLRWKRKTCRARGPEISRGSPRSRKRR